MVVENQLNDNNFVGLISLKDIFEYILNKELHYGDIHKSYNVLKLFNINIYKNYISLDLSRIHTKEFENQ